MRKLGRGQSVMFVAPPEVHRTILEVNGQPMESQVQTSDVLYWAMEETCRAMHDNFPHWASQGFSYESRRHAWSQYSLEKDLERLKSSLLEPEGQTLKELYGLENTSIFTNVAREVKEQRPNIRLIEDKSIHFNIKLDSALRGVRVQEEQERELAHEHEREREVQRPPEVQPLDHSLHKDVTTLIKCGKLICDSTAFLPAFDSLSAALQRPRDQVATAWTKQLLVTKDFAQIIQSSSWDKIDDFLRPVRWILSNGDAKVLVVMSPFEVNELLPDIRESPYVHLHVYSPRVTQAMPSFEDLRFHCVPPLPSSWSGPDHLIVQQLGLFSGQLYLKDMFAYRNLCSFLSLYVDKDASSVADDAIIGHDGFIKTEYRQRNAAHSPFTESPVPFLQILFGLRQKGQSYLLTHMGKILRSEVLTEADFRLRRDGKFFQQFVQWFEANYDIESSA